MPDSILVVEYEPRYIERVRQALSGQSHEPVFAKDGEEAMNLLSSGTHKMIVLSSIIPKISTSELIRRVRAIPAHKMTPILITVSGYNGKSPTADAIKLGATDILPKPYSEGEFVNKVKQLVGGDVAEATIQIPMMTPEQVASASKLTSDDIFGDLTDSSAAKAAKQVGSDVDAMLSKTLSGIQDTPRKSAAASVAAQKSEALKRTADVDKLLETTLSGLDISRSRPSGKTPPAADRPAPKAAPVPETPAPERPQPKPEVKAEPPATRPVAPRPGPPASEAPKPAAPPPRSAPPPKPDLPAVTEQVPIMSTQEMRMPEPEVPAPPVAEVPKPVPPAPPPTVSPEGSISLSSPVLPDKSPDVPGDDDVEDGISFGQYSLLEKIATGGMAEVWKARMKGVEGFQKTVAIKKILPHMSDNEEFLTMFVDEAKLAAQLSHNNIIHIYDLGKISSSYFIAMEYIDGHDLKSILRTSEETSQPVAIELALFITSKIAQALDYAHRKRDFDEKELSLVHRDVSPQNVLISYEGDIKLCDFGIAKAASKATHTIAGALKGKLQYMSPEQAWGKAIDNRSDIFALAAVLFEMLTRRKLFSGESEMSVLEQVREGRVKPPSSINDEVTPEIDAIVLKALGKEPADRYQTAGDFARDLDEILYSFRPTPTSADLAIHMHRLYIEAPVAPPATHHVIEEPEPEPEAFSPEPVAVVPPPIVAPAPRAPEPAMAVAEVPAIGGDFDLGVEEEKKFPIVPVAIAAVVLAGLVGVGGFMTMGKKSAAPDSQQAAAATPPAAATTAAPETADVTDTATSDLIDPEAAATATGLDQVAIDEEVQRRLQSERDRLDRQRQADLTESQAAPKEAPPPPPRQQPAAQTSTPPPATVVTPPAATETATAQATPPPPPPPVETPQAPVKQAVKEGDMVPVGTPGLVPPSMAKFDRPVYPPLAKRQRVEGIVIVQALISEDGKVIEAKVLRGVAENVGINEAALEAIKRSSFKPATIDGVKVKAHYTITVPFNL